MPPAKRAPARKPAKPTRPAKAAKTAKSTKTAKSAKPARPAKPVANSTKPAGKPAKVAPPAKAVAMKAKPTSVKSSLADRLATAVIPEDAWGLSQVEPGVGISPHIDKLLALGFPHMVTVVDEPMPKLTGKRALAALGITRVACREMVHRLYAYHRALRSGDPEAAFAADPAPFELESVVDDELATESWNRVWLLEAMFGAERVAEAFVDAYVKLPTQDWFESPMSSSGYITMSGFGKILDRTPATTRERLRGTLEALYAKLAAIEDWSRGVSRLDVVLHGRPGLERQNPDGRYMIDEYAWARDRAWIEDKVLAAAARWTNRDGIWFDAHLAFVGGPKVLAALRALVAKKIVKADYRDAVAAQLALFA